LAGFLGVLIGVVQIVGVAQSSDPVLGTWKLNLAKSKYNPGPPPKSNTTSIEALGRRDREFDISRALFVPIGGYQDGRV